MNGINEISSHTSMLENVSLILMIASIALFIGSVVLWFVLKIPHAIRVLTRGEKNYSLPSPETIRFNDDVPAGMETEVLNETGSEETIVLAQEETVVLTSSDVDFEVEEDIIITGTNKTLG